MQIWIKEKDRYTKTLIQNWTIIRAFVNNNPSNFTSWKLNPFHSWSILNNKEGWTIKHGTNNRALLYVTFFQWLYVCINSKGICRINASLTMLFLLTYLYDIYQITDKSNIIDVLQSVLSRKNFNGQLWIRLE